MRMMDCVEVIVEKDRYVKDGVHKGMQGWICMEQYRNGYWLINFPQLGENPDISTLGIKEEDLKLIPVMNARINEQIKAQFDAAEQDPKASEDITDYMI